MESKDSSEFEITLDSSSGELEVEPSAESASDSEFDLSLDDSGSISASGEQDAIDQEGTDRDIFETDFDVPGLDEESSSQEAGLDGQVELESSDFDIEDESGSQVVALDDEAEVEPPSPKQRGKGRPTQGKSLPALVGDVSVEEESPPGFGELEAEIP